jgi:dGTPase
VTYFGEFYAEVEARNRQARTKLKFNEALRHVLDVLATDLIINTRWRVQSARVQSAEDVRRVPLRLVSFSDTAREQNAQLKRFLFAHVYNHPLITEDCERSIRCLEELFAYYLQQANSMPESFEEMNHENPRHVVVCDYIAGMTDQFLLRQHQEHLGSTSTAPPSLVRGRPLE